MDVTQAIELGIVAAGAAIVGSMLGLGGGVFLVPIFTLFFGVDQKLAIGASAVAVVTNSVVGSSVHLRSGFTNLRLAMLLQVTMASGALIGALTSVFAPERIINAIFGAVLLYAAVSMALRRQAVPANGNRPDPWCLGATFYDPAARRTVRYVPERVKLGLGMSGVAGVISGMLGVGGGVIQVPAMNLLMRVPVKAAAGTSAFMVGITSVATAFVFYAEEKMDPRVVVPAIIGIFAGSQLGSRPDPAPQNPAIGAAVRTRLAVSRRLLAPESRRHNRTGAAMSALNTNEPEAILAAEAEAEIEALEEAEHHPVSALPPSAHAAITSLTWGFRLGAALLIVGLAVAAIKQESLGERTDPFVEIFPAVLDGQARGIVDLAIVTLMATPVVTTLVVAVGFFREGDRRYGLFSLMVLVVLGISVSLSLFR